MMNPLLLDEDNQSTSSLSVSNVFEVDSSQDNHHHHRHHPQAPSLLPPRSPRISSNRPRRRASASLNQQQHSLYHQQHSGGASSSDLFLQQQQQPHNNMNGMLSASTSPTNSQSQIIMQATPDHKSRKSTTRHRHHHRRQYSTNSTSMSMSTSTCAADTTSDPLSNHPPPNFRVVVHVLWSYCTGWKQPCRKLVRLLTKLVGSCVLLVLLLTAWLAYDFYSDATAVCRPNPTTTTTNSHNKPLVEYYVHGRGMGHYARSVSIVETLNDAGVDVRMFLSRAAMWRALHEDASKHTNENHQDDTSSRGTTTAIAVASITPSFSVIDTISHILERIVGDCEVSSQRNRYPQLIVADGDLPGMLRAKVGGIPSVGIAHGQLFNIAVRPPFIAKNRKLSKSWDRQHRLNARASYFSEWQIATHFCFLESRVSSGVVARAPMRPEVIHMATARRQASTSSSSSNSTTIPELPFRAKMEHHLLEPVVPVSAAAVQEEGGGGVNQNSTTTTTTTSTTTTLMVPPKQRRKVVICYFRDRNGDVVVDALLDAGFDVLLFDNGYMKGRPLNDDPNRYGAQWIVDNEQRDAQWNELQRSHGFGGGDHGDNDRKRKSVRRRARRLSEESETTAADSLSRHHHHHHHHHHHRSLTASAATTVVNDQDDDDKPRLIRVTDRSLFTPLMHVADGVASSAGSQLMSECIYSNMPLLALYLEHDDEQRLNVELSKDCKNPHVFGTSFETFRTTIPALFRRHKTQTTSQPIQSKTKAWQEFHSFMKSVEQSQTSQAFYDQYSDDSGSRSSSSSSIQSVSSAGTNPTNATNVLFVEEQQQHPPHPDDNLEKNPQNEEEPNAFVGLPDAAEIILEILKKVDETNDLMYG